MIICFIESIRSGGKNRLGGEIRNAEEVSAK